MLKGKERPWAMFAELRKRVKGPESRDFFLRFAADGNAPAAPGAGSPLRRRSTSAEGGPYNDDDDDEEELDRVPLDSDSVLRMLSSLNPQAAPADADFFMAMVDVDGDNRCSWHEACDGIRDARDVVDAVWAVASGAGGSRSSSSGSAELTQVEQMLTQALQHLQQHAAAPIRSFVTRQKQQGQRGVRWVVLRELLKQLLPHVSRDMLRLLLAHVHITCHTMTAAGKVDAKAAAESLPFAALQAALGLSKKPGLQGGAMARPVGTLQGGARQLFTMLRFHVKKNTAQLAQLWPPGAEMSTKQLRRVLKELMASRQGEEQLSGRELRHILAMLDADGSATLSHHEFTTGLKTCREIRASMQEWMASPLERGAGHAIVDPLLMTCGQLQELMKQLARDFAARRAELEVLYSELDARGRKRLDQVELRQLLLRAAPQLTLFQVRCLLTYLDLWDPSPHGVLSFKQLLMGLRMQPPPSSLAPPPAKAPAPPATAGGTARSGAAASQLFDMDGVHMPAGWRLSGHRQPMIPEMQALMDKAIAALAVDAPLPKSCGNPRLFEPTAEHETRLRALEEAAATTRLQARLSSTQRVTSRPPAGERPSLLCRTASSARRSCSAASRTSDGPLRCSSLRSAAGRTASAMPQKQQALADAADAAPRDSCGSGQLPAHSAPQLTAMPTKEQWQKWHANVITAERLSGAVATGSLLSTCSGDGWWKLQWKWHRSWLRHALSRSRAALVDSMVSALDGGLDMLAALPASAQAAEQKPEPANALRAGSAREEWRPYPSIPAAVVPHNGRLAARLQALAAQADSGAAPKRKRQILELSGGPTLEGLLAQHQSKRTALQASSGDSNERHSGGGGGGGAEAVPSLRASKPAALSGLGETEPSSGLLAAASQTSWRQVPALVLAVDCVRHAGEVRQDVGDVEHLYVDLAPAPAPAAAAGSSPWAAGPPPGGGEAWWLERVEVRDHSRSPPLEWSMHYRGWVRCASGAADAEDTIPASYSHAPSSMLPHASTPEPEATLHLTHKSARRSTQRGPDTSGYRMVLRPDALTWERWELGLTRRGRPVEVCLNHNLREAAWAPPAPVPMLDVPGAVPHLPLKYRQHLGRLPPGVQEWPFGTPVLMRSRALRYLDSVQEIPRRLHPSFPLGKSGALGMAPGILACAGGRACQHSLAMHARGGYDSARRRMRPQATESPGEPAPVEVVGVSFDVAAMRQADGQLYSSFASAVALDDSVLQAAAPVEFVLLGDSQVLWRSRPLSNGGVLDSCLADVSGVSQISLTVHSAFSGYARALWLDPHLTTIPPPPLRKRRAYADNLAESSVSGLRVGQKVEWVEEKGGEVVYLAASGPSQPDVQAGSAATAAYVITLHTSDLHGAGTGGLVSVRMRKAGSGSSGVLTEWAELNTGTESLPQSSRRGFIVHLKDVGPPAALLLRHQPKATGGSARSAGGPDDWHLLQAEVLHCPSGKTRFFQCNSWLKAASEQQGHGAAEEQALRLEALPWDSGLYRVMFHLNPAASPDASAGSRSSGFAGGIAGLFGLRRDPAMHRGIVGGPLVLRLTGTGADGQERMRSVSVPTLGSNFLDCVLDMGEPLPSIESLAVKSSEGSRLAAQLKLVEVQHLGSGQTRLFRAAAEADRQAAGRSVPAPPQEALLQVEKRAFLKLSTFTSDLPDAGTDATVTASITGSRGNLLDLPLATTQAGFERGSEDSFFFANPGLGELRSISIHHDDQGPSPNWHLHRVQVLDTNSGSTVVFPCSRWLGSDDEDMQLGAFLYPLGESDADADSDGDGGPVVGEGAAAGAAASPPVPSLAAQTTYQVMLHLEQPPSSSTGARRSPWSSLQLLGEVQGQSTSSPPAIIDAGRHQMDRRTDTIFLRSMADGGFPNPGSSAAAATAAAAQAAPSSNGYGAGGSDGYAEEDIEDTDSDDIDGVEACRPSGLRSYQIALHFHDLYRPPPGTEGVAPNTADDSVSVLLWGTRGRVGPLVLSAATCLDPGRPPFQDARRADVFSEEAEDIGEIVRLELKIADPQLDWGMLLDQVVVKHRLGSSVVFPAPGPRWLGLSPTSGHAGGAESLWLQPNTMLIYSLSCRDLGTLQAVLLRTDSPDMNAGLRLKAADVFMHSSGKNLRLLRLAPAPTAPYAPGCQVTPTDAPFYQCLLSPQALAAGKTEAELLPVLPHAVNTCYSPEARAELRAEAELGDDDRQALLQAAEEEAAQIATGSGNVYTFLLKLLKAQPALLTPSAEACESAALAATAARERLQADHPPPSDSTAQQLWACSRSAPAAGAERAPAVRLTRELAVDILVSLVPQNGLPERKDELIFQTMIDMADAQAGCTRRGIVRAMKQSRDAVKQAASLARQVRCGAVPDLDADVGGAELVLRDLAYEMWPSGKSGDTKKSGGVDAAADAFAAFDQDGSGFLEAPELVHAFRQLRPAISDGEVRLLLQYLCCEMQADGDGRVSLAELQAALAPFSDAPLAPSLPSGSGFGGRPQLPPASQALEWAEPDTDTAGGGAAAVIPEPREGAELRPLFVKLEAAGAKPAHAEDGQALQQTLLAAVFDAEDQQGVGDGRLWPSDAAKALKRVLPFSAAQDWYALAMISLARTLRLRRDELRQTLYECAAVEQHVEAFLARDASDDAPLALCKAAQLLCADAEGPQSNAEDVFKAVDSTGDGRLGPIALCRAFKELDPGMQDRHLRVLLAFMQTVSRTAPDGELTLGQVVVALMPFVGKAGSDFDPGTAPADGQGLAFGRSARNRGAGTPGMAPTVLTGPDGSLASTSGEEWPFTTLGSKLMQNADGGAESGAALYCAAFAAEDAEGDSDGRLWVDEALRVVRRMVAVSDSQSWHMQAMLGLARSSTANQLSLEGLHTAVHDCAAAELQVARLQQAGAKGGNAPTAICRLASLICSQAQQAGNPDASGKAEEVFKAMDSTGDGRLGPLALCRAFKELDGGLMEQQLRVLLAFLQQEARQAPDGELTLGQVVVALMPFAGKKGVDEPRPPIPTLQIPQGDAGFVFGGDEGARPLLARAGPARERPPEEGSHVEQLFSRLWAAIQRDPEGFQEAMEEEDAEGDFDALLWTDECCRLARRLLPFCHKQDLYLQAMLSAGDMLQLTSQGFADAVQQCAAAEAAALQAMQQPEAAPAAVCRAASAICSASAQATKQAEAAFQRHPGGKLAALELWHELRVLGGSPSDDDLRLLLALLHVKLPAEAEGLVDLPTACKLLAPFAARGASLPAALAAPASAPPVIPAPPEPPAAAPDAAAPDAAAPDAAAPDAAAPAQAAPQQPEAEAVPPAEAAAPQPSAMSPPAAAPQPPSSLETAPQGNARPTSPERAREVFPRLAEAIKANPERLQQAVQDMLAGRSASAPTSSDEAVAVLRAAAGLQQEEEAFTVTMLALGQGSIASAADVRPLVKACRDAEKQAQSLTRMVQRGMLDVPSSAAAQASDDPLDAPVRALSALSTALVGAEGSGSEVFARLDTSGDGRLGMAELCSAFRALQPGLRDEQLRLVLAYMRTADTDRSGALSLQETAAALRPFLNQQDAAKHAYSSAAPARSPFAAMLEWHKVDKTRLAASIRTQQERQAQRSGTAATLLDAVLEEVCLSAGCSPKETQYAQVMVALDAAAAADAGEEAALRQHLKSCRDAHKAAAALVRQQLVESEAQAATGEASWGGEAAVVLAKLAAALGGPGGAEAFSRFDADGSGALSIQELAQALSQLAGSAAASDQLRLALAFCFLSSPGHPDASMRHPQITSLLRRFAAAA